MSGTQNAYINDTAICELLEKHQQPETALVTGVLTKASEMKGLSLEDVSILLNIKAPEQIQQLFETANHIKDTIYGKRLVLFAPLYITNLCANECTYCAFRAKNKEIVRRALTQAEIIRETEALIKQGHKRVLLVAGESYPKQGFQYVLDSVRSVYKARFNDDEIRRVNVNVAPLTVDEFKLLKAEKIGTYQIFQETYHRDTYKKVHVGGKKMDYDFRVSAIHRAMEAGIDDVGIGVLFGLYNYRYEVLAMMQHINELEQVFGVGPHTISVPRMEPATGSDMSIAPPHPLSDEQFKQTVAILRCAVPYTGIIMSTRENAQMRRDTFALGISQISAGSRTNPGGYEEEDDISGQFSLGDHRHMDEVIRDVASMGYVPSFCTGCYRLGRTGQDFMDIAKPGAIKAHCGPNALSSFMEYLNNYASPETYKIGTELIEKTITEMDGLPKSRAEKLVARVKGGQSDVYC